MSDRRALLSENGNWYKANLHTHSTISDGHYTPLEVRDLYRNHGYSVLALTDHEFLVPHTDLCEKDFLMLTSYEAQIRGDLELPAPMRRISHLNFYARDPEQRKCLSSTCGMYRLTLPEWISPRWNSMERRSKKNTLSRA